MLTGKRGEPARPLREGAGLGAYLKEAFLYRWNVLLFFGGLAASILSPWPDALLPLVGALELAYLAGLVSFPRFRIAVDAWAHQERKASMAVAPAMAPSPERSVAAIVNSLPREDHQRFEKLRTRCLEMRSIARRVGGRAAGTAGAGEDMHTPALDRLLWVFLRLLLSKNALDHFLESTSEPEIQSQLEGLRKSLESARQGGDERLVRSLTDSIAVSEMRLDNHQKAAKNAQFLTVELIRIEGKIQALAEMAVNRQDPDYLTSQVDSVAETARQTEQAISELQQITGLTEELEEAPPILETGTKELLREKA